MSRQIEIDGSGCLSKIGEEYIECPLKMAANTLKPKLCTEYCAWFKIDDLGNALCGEKLIGQLIIKKEE